MKNNIKNNNSIWITANAGSGKTTFLTKRVIALLLQGVAPERIYCITYTKAAASEMRARVLARLRALLLAEKSECKAQVESILERSATEEEIARARGLFGLVLDSVSGGITLTTIHGFCQTLLRRFPLEAGVAPHFTVLEDMAAERVLAKAKHRLLAAYDGADASLNAALSLMGSRVGEARLDAIIAAMVSDRGKWQTLWRGQTPESLRQHLFALHGLPADITEEALQRAQYASIAAEEEAPIRAHLPALLSHKSTKLQAMGEILGHWLATEPAARGELLAGFTALFLTQSDTVRDKILTKTDVPETSSLAPLRPLLHTIAERLAQLRAESAALACAEETYAVAILARALLDLYAQGKAEAHALDYDDLIGKTRALLANPALAGWVMHKLDHRIDHLLIDEAQDTSHEQWAIADALVEELIAANDGIGSGTLPRSLLVVGDEKQSIYSFQGAAPELFSAQRVRFAERLSQSAAPVKEVTLATSYRSAQAILSLVNHLAAQAEIRPALSAGDDIAPHILHREQAAGQVVLYPPLIAPEVEKLPPLTLPMAYRLAQTPQRQLAEHIAQTVADWLQTPRLLESEGRPVRPGDILILVRTRGRLVLPLIRALQRREVPVAGLDRLTLSAHLAVRDLLALMRFVLNPADDLALAHVLRSPLVGLSDEALRAYCVGRDGALWSRVTGADRAVPERALASRHLTPYEFLTEQLEVMGARVKFAERFGAEVQEVLDELKSQAAAMPQGMAPTLANFHDWMAGSAREVKREQESSEKDQVRIMTVHGAKGLEAPIVILADTVSIPTTQREIVYFTRSNQAQLLPTLALSDDAKRAPVFASAKQQKADALRAEYYRLLYVALTRARDELHLFAAGDKQGNVKPGSWYALVRETLSQLGAVPREAGGLLLKDARPSVAARPLHSAPLATILLPQWAKQAPAALTKLHASVSPSQLAPQPVSVSPYVAQMSEDVRARGVRIHRMLELIRAESDVSEIETLVSHLAPDWSKAEQAKVAQEIAAIHRAERWLWQYPSHAEATIAGMVEMNGERIPFHGQIDRLIELPDTVVILDYKTGRHVPSDPSEIPENYRLQLKTYHALVAQAYPEKPVRSAILWTSAPRLMWCDEAVATTAWPKAVFAPAQA